MKKIIWLSYFSLILGLLLSLTSCTDTYIRPNSNIFEPVIASSPIPKGYDTYTFFLVPSYNLKFKYSQEEWKGLMLAFESLGNSIGKQNAAIWFFNADRKTPSIERARSIVDQINRSNAKNVFSKLHYNKAPIIVFMNYNPELVLNDEKNFYTAIQWDNKDSKKVIEFMDELAQLIRNDNLHLRTLETKQIVIEIGEFLSAFKEDGISIIKNIKNTKTKKNTSR